MNISRLESTTLVTVVHGRDYRRFAVEMFESADGYFKPTPVVHHLTLEGRPGWPDATMYRWHALLADLPRTTYVFLIDADMRFDAPVGPEILPPRTLGITATQHPGYVGLHREQLPYERRRESAAYVASWEGERYYCGGFIGGERLAVRLVGSQIAEIIDTDARNKITPIWHDESALNRVLANGAPDVMLSPAYCHPADDTYYRQHVWTEEYKRIITALDKTAAQRGLR